MSAIDDISAERRRQIDVEGWTAAHDDEHSDGELARAAACYAYFSTLLPTVREIDAISKDGRATTDVVVVRRAWPWSWTWWKPKDRRRDLIRAGALIVAEIERLDRIKAQSEKP